MKTFAALIFLVMFVVSCGGGADGLAKDPLTRANASVPAFEPPPAPGSN